MSIDKKIEIEYILLRNYLEHGLIGRGFQLKISFNALDQIEKNQWDIVFSDNDKPVVRNLIQIDIISKIMMYIEDIAIISTSFLKGRTYYEIIIDKSIDLGELIGNFYNEMDDITDNELLKIMNYTSLAEVDIENKFITKVIQKNIISNIFEIKRIFKEIATFSKTHHILFKRFKHAGFPIISGSTGNNLLSNFDSVNIVSAGEDPLKDVIPIPFSKEVLEGYRIIIHGIQNLLKDIVNNRIECIIRNIPTIIPKNRYNLTVISKDEVKIMEDELDKHNSLHPIESININVVNEKEIKKESLEWYLQLPKFLETCK